LVTYVVVLLTIGMPVLLLELTLGAWAKGGDPKAFGHMNPRFAGVGAASILAVFIIYIY